jgi:Cu2+-exporting ATPase
MKLETKDPEIKKLQEQGKTVVFTVVNGKLAGAFALSDRIREESREAIRKLKKTGVKVYMLTGDAEEVAEWVAKELGIDDYFAPSFARRKNRENQTFEGERPQSSHGRRWDKRCPSPCYC